MMDAHSGKLCIVMTGFDNITMCACPIHTIINSLPDHLTGEPLTLGALKGLTNFFSAGELRKAIQFKSSKRQVEWFAGRIAAKRAFMSFFDTTNLKDVEILNESGGAPYFVNQPNLSLSISHSGEYAVAAVSRYKLGIDIEKIKGIKERSFLKIAFTSREMKFIERQTPRFLYVAWTMKEAFLKYLKRGFSESLHNVEYLNHTIYYHQQPLLAVASSNYMFGDYTMSLVTEKYNNYVLPKQKSVPLYPDTREKYISDC